MRAGQKVSRTWQENGDRSEWQTLSSGHRSSSRFKFTNWGGGFPRLRIQHHWQRCDARSAKTIAQTKTFPAIPDMPWFAKSWERYSLAPSTFLLSSWVEQRVLFFLGLWKLRTYWTEIFASAVLLWLFSTSRDHSQACRNFFSLSTALGKSAGQRTPHTWVINVAAHSFCVSLLFSLLFESYELQK